MILSYEGLKDKAGWEKAGVKLPQFDYETVCAETEKNPVWVHIGAGNIFRAFIARTQQVLLNEGLAKSGIVAVSTHNYELVKKVYEPFDNMTLLVSLLPDGSTEKEVIASVTKALCVGKEFQKDLEDLKNIFRNPSLQMVSYTITEKGYTLWDLNGNVLPNVAAELEAGPENCMHAMCFTTAMLWERYNAGAYPLAVVSMDNCSHNGDKVRSSVLTIAKEWEKRGFVSAEFVAWVENENHVSFPWSMIDKITPRPSSAITEMLEKAGIENMGLIPTDSRTNSAPFVNAEKPEYLVIEDKFPNGRPALEKAGVYLTDRDTVNNTEKMKVTTCLNPLHTTLAVYGCLLGYKLIADEMNDPELKALVEKIGYIEGLPVVVDPKILSPKEFIDVVIGQRLPNPFMPDTPQRIATDTSQKVGVRFGETIKSYIADPALNAADLTYVPLAIAGWLRYLIAVDENGDAMVCSPDPMLETLQDQLAGVTLGNPDSVSGKLDAILTNTSLFGTDLIAAGLGEKIETMLKQMLTGPGAIRQTLKAYL